MTCYPSWGKSKYSVPDLRLAAVLTIDLRNLCVSLLLILIFSRDRQRDDNTSS